MKKVTCILTRHGKNVVELGSTLVQQEIDRATEVGDSIYQAGFENIDMVVTSPLPRAIQTGFAVIRGHETTEYILREAEPAFGTDALFKEMTSPQGFKAIASVKGNFPALFDFHAQGTVHGWVDAMTGAVLGFVRESDNGDAVLFTIHSPSVEMICYGLNGKTFDGLPDEYHIMAELDTAIVVVTLTDEGELENAEFVQKIPAPAIEAAN